MTQRRVARFITTLGAIAVVTTAVGSASAASSSPSLKPLVKNPYLVWKQPALKGVKLLASEEVENFYLHDLALESVSPSHLSLDWGIPLTAYMTPPARIIALGGVLSRTHPLVGTAKIKVLDVQTFVKYPRLMYLNDCFDRGGLFNKGTHVVTFPVPIPNDSNWKGRRYIGETWTFLLVKGKWKIQSQLYRNTCTDWPPYNPG